MKVHKGNAGIIIVFMLVVTSVMATFIQSIIGQTRFVENERSSYVEYYNREAMLDLSVVRHIGALCKTIEMPIDLLNNNIYSYEKALSLVTWDLSVATGELIDSLGNPAVIELLQKSVQGGTVTLSCEQVSPDYENAKNILFFKSGDILYLKDINIHVSYKVKGKEYTKEYTVKNLFCKIEHRATAFKLEICDTEVIIS